MKRTLGTLLLLALPASLLHATTEATAAAKPVPHETAYDARHRVTEPLVIAHRGASGHRPEHTLAAYALAISMGADYIEPDLVSTKDGVLVARHENEISGTTDVADRPRFADRRTTKTIDGRAVTGWFTEDFTLRELRTLRAKERLPLVRPGNTAYDGRYRVPTFDQVLALARAATLVTGRTIGVYPETKHPTYFDSLGLSMEEPLVRSLQRFGLDHKKAPVFVQSFETGNLRDLDRLTKVRIAQLVDASGAPYDLVAAGDPRTYRDLVTPAGLKAIARYADGVGTNKALVIDPATLTETGLVDAAHRAGLDVHVWTLRNENQFMAPGWRIGSDPNAFGDVAAEYAAFFDAGVDGIFSDYPDTAVQQRRAWSR